MSHPVDSSNTLRGEAKIAIAGQEHLLRPTFNALVCAEEELGPLFALVERAGEGQLSLREIACLFWHCAADKSSLTREAVGQGVVDMGLAQATTPLRTILKQILQGSA